ncbi:MAG: hypothetical protein C0605_17055 [Hyphomicrobiales bacterium]|nr:MAG: hypothetical protein C0605_17055 [Hyphomicrobiales bacterium]
MSGPERDALIWASMGKSVPEISEEMHLPDQDTIFLLESARHKLGAANWTHAVVLALRRKLIAI